MTSALVAALFVLPVLVGCGESREAPSPEPFEEGELTATAPERRSGFSGCLPEEETVLHRRTEPSGGVAICRSPGATEAVIRLMVPGRQEIEVPVISERVRLQLLALDYFEAGRELVVSDEDTEYSLRELISDTPEWSCVLRVSEPSGASEFPCGRSIHDESLFDVEGLGGMLWRSARDR